MNHVSDLHLVILRQNPCCVKLRFTEDAMAVEGGRGFSPLPFDTGALPLTFSSYSAPPRLGGDP